MSQKLVFYCDGCGIERGSVNHWWETYENTACWEVTPFDEKDIKRDPKIRIFCGQQCVTKALSTYMEQHRATSEKERQV